MCLSDKGFRGLCSFPAFVLRRDVRAGGLRHGGLTGLERRGVGLPGRVHERLNVFQGV